MSKLHSLEMLSVRHNSGQWPTPDPNALVSYLHRACHTSAPLDAARLCSLIDKQPGLPYILGLDPEEVVDLREILELRSRHRW